jgi:hypothetical protein
MDAGNQTSEGVTKSRIAITLTVIKKGALPKGGPLLLYLKEYQCPRRNRIDRLDGHTADIRISNQYHFNCAT